VFDRSDNGGCYGGGGKNGPLRGTKGSLFEGGVKVDSFVYSPLLPSSAVGSTYLGLFHISDWFPTILEMTQSTFTAEDGFALDGVSHVKAWTGDEDYPRTTMLYNYYANVDFYTFNLWTNGSFAVRNQQYKLMHHFNSSTYGAWFSTSEIDEDDDDLAADVRCAPQACFGDGDFTYYLFDLISDPYETTNLYYSEDIPVSTARETLYKLLPEYYMKSTEITASLRGNQKAFKVWKDHADFIVPFVKDEDLEGASGEFPSDCYES
jgi:arylsulfatase A-like enzyme